MSNKTKLVASEQLDRQALSEFAYQKTDLTDNAFEGKPFGSRNYKRMKGILMQRVNASRYVHSLSVAKTARKIARAYDLDAHKARMAGLLHDWDKALSPERLRDRVNDYHLDIDEETIADMPWVLHGPTAAAVLAEQFPELGEDVYQAIARHTVPSTHMSELDMIVFIADKIEPTHDVAAYKRLNKQIGELSLENLFFEVQKAGLLYLIESQRPMNVDTVKAWNFYVKEQSKNKEKRK